MNEQIKSLIDSEIKKGFDSFGQALLNFSIPLISNYRLFTFTGSADGVTDLAANFQQEDIQGKILIIKSIQIVPYYPAGGVINEDFYTTDGGGTINQELLPGACRIERIFDQYGNSGVLNLIINGSSSPLFPIGTTIVPPFVEGNIPIDANIDNIFYKYPQKLQSLAVQFGAQIFNDLQGASVVTPLVKIYLQCYLY